MSKDQAPDTTAALLPCPFCGGVRLVDYYGRRAYVHCNDCGADGPRDWEPEEARRLYNLRATPQPSAPVAGQVALSPAEIAERVRERCVAVCSESAAGARFLRDAARNERDHQGALVHAAEYAEATSNAAAIRAADLSDIGAPGADQEEIDAFKRGAEAMRRVLAEAMRDHLDARAAAIANGVSVPEYRP